MTKLTALVLGAYLFSACQSEPSPDKSRAEDLFVEVSERVGLNFKHDPGVDGSYFMPESIGSGCAFLDYDNDNDLDIYLLNGAVHNRTSAHKILRNHLFQQESDGSFIDVTVKSGLGDTGYGMGVAAADMDNDGDVDVYISNYGPDALYRNNGDGTFTNITQAAGISNPRWGASVVFLDYNLDGFLDIYVTNYVDYDPLHACLDLSGRKDYCGPAGFDGVPWQSRLTPSGDG
ncbi:MAG: FG-GAP repeat domain-containing protein, partial [bacterium]